MALIIGFGGPTKLALEQLETWPDTSPGDSAYCLPYEAKNGDRVLWYVGGSLKSFVGIGRTTCDWWTARSGAWKGIPQMGTSKPKILEEYVSGVSVANACGLKAPTGPGVVPTHLARQVLAFIQGKPIDHEGRALEGALTETRSRKRNQALREAARAKANGVCAGCGTDFKQYAGGFGQRCLVVHHKKQLADFDQPVENSVSDLVVLCANCHMIVHTDQQHAMSIPELRKKLKTKQGS